MNEFSQIDIEYMHLALAEAALAAESGEVPAGAVVADQSGQVIGRGRNRVISLSDPTAHAEILALREAAAHLGNYRLTGLALYSTLEPCPMCLTAAIHARLGRVVYGAAEPKWGAAGSLMDLPALKGLNHILEIRGGLLADEARLLITDFFKARRKKGEGAIKIVPGGDV